MKRAAGMLLSAMLLFSMPSYAGSAELTPAQLLDSARTAYAQQHYARAAELYQQGADLGDACALDALGRMTCDGQGVAKDVNKGLAMIRRAAEAGTCSEAMYHLGKAYRNGEGVIMDGVTAAGWYQRAWEAQLWLNDSEEVAQDAPYWLAWIYEKGAPGVEIDAAKAFLWMERSAMAGKQDAMVQLARYYTEGYGVVSSGSMAAEWHEKAGEAALAEKMPDAACRNAFAAAELYAHGGMGVTIDVKRAARNHIIAISTGSVASWSDVDAAVRSGDVSDDMLEQLFAAVSDAADTENEIQGAMQYNLAHMLRKGYGAAADLPSAEAAYERALDLGCSEAASELSLMPYYRGEASLLGVGMPQDNDAAFAALNESLALGHPLMAQNYYYLAQCYEYGLGTAADPARALELYEQAQVLGMEGLDAAMAGAVYRLGEAYLFGNSVAADYQQAYALLTQAAEAEHPWQSANLFYLGQCSELGFGTPVDMDQALALYEQAAAMGSREAQARVAVAKFRIGEARLLGRGGAADYEAAFALLSETAAMKHSELCGNLYYLGQCYEYGLGTPIDLTQALAMYERAAALGSSEAEARMPVVQFREGERYLLGRDAAVDYDRAFEILSEAAQHPHAELRGNLYYLGQCYEYGFGTDADEAQAAALYEQAASLGSVEAALRRLSLRFHEGERYLLAQGTAADYDAAFAILTETAQHGHAELHANLYYLGQCYEHGFGVDRDLAKALMQYQHAAELGSAEAQARIGVVQYRMGEQLLLGTAGETDYDAAYELLRQASLSEHAEMAGNLYYLAQCYHHGFGTQPDLAQAAALYQQAIALGADYAKASLKAVQAQILQTE